MFDIFFLGQKPNLFPHEQSAVSIADARNKSRTKFFWLVNGNFDYSNFDFYWMPPPWEQHQTHVFPSQWQRNSGTMFCPTHCIEEVINYHTDKQVWNKENAVGDSRHPDFSNVLYDHWFNTKNYATNRLSNMSLNVVEYDSDSVVNAIKSHVFAHPYAIFKHRSVTAAIPQFTQSFCNNQNDAIHQFSKSGSVLVVPRAAKDKIYRQVYDFTPIITHSDLFVSDQDLDIVYISNGEDDAQRWYDHLVACAPNQKIHWVKDVTGREAAYKAAANISTTQWFFAVFAKLEVNPEFDWTWQPDRLQEAKHYIFNALNPVNGLEYGHQAMIAYNKNLVLDTDQSGLDFTLSKPHEVVDLLSGTAHYNVSPIITWRTSFREALKLKAAGDNDSTTRLLTWTAVAEGNNARWSLAGANDAVEYYKSVNGSPDKLLLSFDWKWLNEYFTLKYHKTVE